MTAPRQHDAVVAPGLRRVARGERQLEGAGHVEDVGLAGAGLGERGLRAADEAVGEVLVEARDDDREAHRSPSPHPLPSPRRPRRCSISSSRLSALVVQGVAHALGLGAQVALVVGVGHVLDRDLLADAQPVALQAVDLLGVVGEDPDRAQPEVDEDLGADAVLAQVGGQAELEVGVDGVEALLLELVGAQLVEQADAAPLLGEVDEHAAALALDHRQRRLELLAAVAAQRVEDVAGQALRVHAHEHVVGARDVALDERDVVLVVDQRAVADDLEVAEGGGQRRRRRRARRACRCAGGRR